MSIIKIKIQTDNIDKNTDNKFVAKNNKVSHNKEIGKEYKEIIDELIIKVLLENVEKNFANIKFKYRRLNKELFLVVDSNSNLYFYITIKKLNYKFVSPDKKLYIHINKNFLEKNIHISLDNYKIKKLFINEKVIKQFLYEFSYFYDELPNHLQPDLIIKGDNRNKKFRLELFINEVKKDISKLTNNLVKVNNTKILFIEPNIAKLKLNILDQDIYIVIGKKYHDKYISIIEILNKDLCKLNNGYIDFMNNEIKLLLTIIEYFYKFNEIIEAKKFTSISK